MTAAQLTAATLAGLITTSAATLLVVLLARGHNREDRS